MFTLIRTPKLCHVLLWFCGSGTRTSFLAEHWGWQNCLSVCSNVLGMFWTCSENWPMTTTTNNSIKTTKRMSIQKWCLLCLLLVVTLCSRNWQFKNCPQQFLPGYSLSRIQTEFAISCLAILCSIFTLLFHSHLCRFLLLKHLLLAADHSITLPLNERSSNKDL